MIFILLLFVSGPLKGQFYEYGQDAGTLQWYRFRTPNYQVIYPKGVDSLARAFAGRRAKLFIWRQHSWHKPQQSETETDLTISRRQIQRTSQ